MYTLNKQKEFTMSTKAILIDLMKAISAYQGQGKTSALEAFNCAAKAHLADRKRQRALMRSLPLTFLTRRNYLTLGEVLVTFGASFLPVIK